MAVLFLADLAYQIHPIATSSCLSMCMAVSLLLGRVFNVYASYEQIYVCASLYTHVRYLAYEPNFVGIFVSGT